MWLLVLNRHSGKGQIDKKLQEFIGLCKLNKITYEIIDQDTPKQTETLLRSKLGQGTFNAVIAFGGDGLVSLCLQYLGESSIGFSVVPTGTGNDFARSIGTFGKSISQIFRTIYATEKVKLDLALVANKNSKRYFMQVLSVGFDASVNEYANQMRWPKGKIKYTIAMLRLLPRARNLDLTIISQKQVLQVKSMLIAVANGSTYGGGMKILPDASYSDGMLDLLYVDPVSKLTLLSIFPRVFKGSHINHPAVHILKGEKFELKGNTKSFADGEFIGELPLEISVIKNGLSTWICK